MALHDTLAFGRRPAVLISYYYSAPWPRAAAERAWCRSWCLDSGGFSAYTKGATIDLDNFAAYARDMLASDPTLDQVFTLDNIKSWQETTRNTERLWAAGVPAIPVYHVGEPEDVLIGYARDYPKIALGGMVPMRGAQKKAFVKACFDRIWPKAVHGLGIGGQLMFEVPWHSVDASNWTAAARFGTWAAFNGERIPVRGVRDLRVEIDHLMKQEQLAAHRWAGTLEPVRAGLREAGWRAP